MESAGRGACRGSLHLRILGSLLLRELVQIEVDRSGIAQPGADAVHPVHFLAVDFDRDVVGAHRQTIVEVVALLVGLALVAALDIGADDLDHGLDCGGPVLAFHVAFDRRDLGERGQSQEASSGRGNNQVAKLHRKPPTRDYSVLNSSIP